MRSHRGLLLLTVAVVAFLYVGLKLPEGCRHRIKQAFLSNDSHSMDKGFITDAKFSLIRRKEALVLGQERNSQGFLVIGIPTVIRSHQNQSKVVVYLLQTVHGLLDHLTQEQLQKISIVVFLCDREKDRRDVLLEKIRRDLQFYIDSGLLRVITAPSRYYRKLDGLPENFGDSQQRVKWRSKQNLDYAYLMKYAAPSARYYMQLEDDVIAKEGYLSVIEKGISIADVRQKSWVTIAFSAQGYIAKLYRSPLVEPISNVLMQLYGEMPCDWLVPYLFGKLRVPVLNGPTLFTHIGRHSSSSGT